MNCPVCNVPLTLAERQGVEIDYCPKCRGVWLDRGELDKILERGAALTAAPERREYRDAPEPRYAPERRERDWDDDDQRYGYDPRKRRKRGFLDDIFDFG